MRMAAGILTKGKASSEKLYNGHVYIYTRSWSQRERNADERERVYVKLVDRRLCRTRLNEPQSM
jgi:hypothetical protein